MDKIKYLDSEGKAQELKYPQKIDVIKIKENVYKLKFYEKNGKSTPECLFNEKEKDLVLNLIVFLF